MSMTLAAIADSIVEKAGNASRFIVAIAGPRGPASQRWPMRFRKN